MESLGENIKIFIDYGWLLRTIQKNRNLGHPPTIIGSRPTYLDSLWDRIRKDGYDIHVYDKVIYENDTKKEKMTDNTMGFHIDEIIFTNTPAKIAIFREIVIISAIFRVHYNENGMWRFGLGIQMTKLTYFQECHIV
ncbi:hypothetical protein RhiirA4_458815 [Rhizophagus irregularis]|uniref:Uncharacterized protein n=1 Tax=Rhizophagus irregularis TaxID=588596 RepID=A0A2I1GCZ5_9GLOM|nr:hypothetical protein RhiirA4_458815 [Rhizophagus irregularis]